MRRQGSGYRVTRRGRSGFYVPPVMASTWTPHEGERCGRCDRLAHWRRHWKTAATDAPETGYYCDPCRFRTQREEFPTRGPARGAIHPDVLRLLAIACGTLAALFLVTR